MSKLCFYRGHVLCEIQGENNESCLIGALEGPDRGTSSWAPRRHCDLVVGGDGVNVFELESGAIIRRGTTTVPGTGG